MDIALVTLLVPKEALSMTRAKAEQERPGERPVKMLNIIFLVASLVAIGISIVALVALQMTLSAKHRLLATYDAVALEAAELRVAGERRARDVRAIALRESPGDVAGLLQARHDFQQRLSALASGPGEPALRTEVERIQRLDKRLSVAEEHLVNAIQAGKRGEAVEAVFLREVLPLAAQTEVSVGTLADQAANLVVRARQESDRTDKVASNLLRGMAGLAIAVIMLLAVLLRQNMRKLTSVRDRLHDATLFQRRLMGIVGHDLRSPLSTILMSIGRLHGPEEDGPAFEKGRDRIERNARRMERLIGLLMDVTRVETGLGIPIAPHAGDLHELVGHLVDEVRLASKDRVIEHEQLDDGSGEFDDDRIAQVVTNLLNNALKFSPPGTPVRVVTRGTPNALEIEVHNAGQIAADVLPHVFDPFTKGEPVGEPDTSKFGAGLGLYVVRQLAEAHGGRVEVRSTKEDGTTFHVSFPRHPAPHGPALVPHGELAALH